MTTKVKNPDQTEAHLAISINGAPARSFPLTVLRKICFGGLYVKPDWPMGMQRSMEIRLDLDSITVQ